MKIHPIKCPSCGAPLDIKRGADTCECPSCGCVFSIDNGKLEYTYNKNTYVRNDTAYTGRYVDDADVIRARTEEKEKRRAWIGSWIGWSVLAVAMATLIILGIVSGHNESEKEKQAIASGKISAGYYQDYLEKDYEGVVAQFEAAGFTNIQTIDLHDAGIRFWENGEVVSVSVDGDKQFSRSDYFSPDVKVVISYR